MAKQKIVLLIENEKWRWLARCCRAIVVPGRILDNQDYMIADGEANRFVEAIYERYTSKRERAALFDVFGHPQAGVIIKKQLWHELKEMLLSLAVARKAIKLSLVGPNTLFWPRRFDSELYDLIKEWSPELVEQIRLPRSLLLVKRLAGMVEKFLFALAVINFPRYLYWRALFSRRFAHDTRTFKYVLYLRPTDPGFSDLPTSMDWLIKQGVVSRDELLFVVDAKIGAQYLAQIKAIGYHYVYFPEMLKKANLRLLLDKLKMIAQQLTGTNAGRRLTLKAYLSVLRQAYAWEAFYQQYQVGTFIAIQEPGNPARYLYQKTHGSRSIFLYLSSAYLGDSPYNGYYSRLIFDRLLTSKIPLIKFQRYENYFDRYQDIGIINADLIRRLKADRPKLAELAKQLNIPSDKTIISVFDDNSDTYDTMPIADARDYVNWLKMALEADQRLFFLYKPRSLSVFSREPELRRAFERLVNHERCLFVPGLVKKYSAIELMALSELVITVFSSSTLTEALAGGVKAICFRPRSEINSPFWSKMEEQPELIFHDRDQMSRQIDHWLKTPAERQTACRAIDSYCDGQALKRLKDALK